MSSFLILPKTSIIRRQAAKQIGALSRDLGILPLTYSILPKWSRKQHKLLHVPSVLPCATKEPHNPTIILVVSTYRLNSNEAWKTDPFT